MLSATICDVTPPARSSSSATGPAIVGGVLIVVGIALLVVQQLDVDLGRVGWPLFIIVPGVVMLAVGLLQSFGPGLAIGGTIVTLTGLLLLFQSLTGLYATWAYAWALVSPTGSGIGMFLYGARSRSAGLMRAGSWQILTGLAIFAVGFLFFEGLIGLSGERLNLPPWALPAALMVIGAGFLLRGLFDRPDDTPG